MFSRSEYRLSLPCEEFELRLWLSALASLALPSLLFLGLLLSLSRSSKVVVDDGGSAVLCSENELLHLRIAEQEHETPLHFRSKFPEAAKRS